MVDLNEMLVNLSKSLPDVQYLLGGFSYLLGISLCISALCRLKDNVEKGQSSDPESHMTVPLMYFFVGAILLYLPSTLQAWSATLFGSSANPLQYNDYVPNSIFTAMTILIQTIGLIWLIRGCVLLVHASRPEHGRSNPKSGIKKALFFIFAGLFGTNFQMTVSMMNTLMDAILNFKIYLQKS